MGSSTLLKTFKLADTKDGVISISNIEEPYGEGSKPVISIGISLKGDVSDPDWKAHIPYENLNDLIDALIDAKDKLIKNNG